MYLAIDRESRNAVYVAIELGLICLTIGGCLAFLVGLRNADVWFLQRTGRIVDGVVSKLEFTTGPRETTRRPYVTFQTTDGETVEAASALYRKTIRLAVGDRVRLSYRPGNPRKIAIWGYDFRMREPIGSAAGLVTAIVAILVAVTL
jgi:translation initiation factor IF-1